MPVRRQGRRRTVVHRAGLGSGDGVVTDDPVRVLADEVGVVEVGLGGLERLERLAVREVDELDQDEALAGVLRDRDLVVRHQRGVAHDAHQPDRLVQRLLGRPLVHLEEDEVTEDAVLDGLLVGGAREDGAGRDGGCRLVHSGAFRLDGLGRLGSATIALA